jgi:hypothetical protein
MTYANGNRFDGGFINDADIQGTLNYVNGDIYVGEVNFGMKHGQGKLMYANGNMYEGEFKDDQKFGSGTYTYATIGKNVVGFQDQENNSSLKTVSSYSYDESSIENYMKPVEIPIAETEIVTDEVVSSSGDGGYILSSDGIFIYSESDESNSLGPGDVSGSSGNTITNFFKNLGVGNSDTANNESQVASNTESNPIIVVPSNEENISNISFGKYTYADGDEYIGEVRDGLPHGEGTYMYANGDKYVGQFNDDKRHGQGTYSWASGDKYVGSYVNDQRHGQGTFTFADGDQYVGEFKNGEYIN